MEKKHSLKFCDFRPFFFSLPCQVYLHSVCLPVARAETGSKGTSGNAADHHGHALLAGAVALQLDFPAQFAIRQVGLVAGAVDGETPEVLLAPLGQQSGMGSN